MYNKLPESEKQCALFTDGFLLPCCRKASEVEVICMESSMTSLETAEEEGKPSQFAEVKAIHLLLDIAEGGKWPILYLYTDLNEEMHCIGRLMIERWT